MYFAVLGLKQVYLLPFLDREGAQILYNHTLNIPAPILDRLLPTCHHSQKTRDNVARSDSKVHYDLAN